MLFFVYPTRVHQAMLAKALKSVGECERRVEPT